MNQENQQIVSIYTFSLKKGVEESQFVAASAKLDAMLLALQGFHYRSLTKTQEGSWQDIIYWDNENSMAKADAMESQKDFADFMSLIESHTVRNVKANLYSSVYPGMSENAEQYVETA